MFNNWPYTNLNELNLDWILQQVKGIVDKYKDLDSAIAAGVEAVQHQEETSLQDMDNMKMTIISAINGARDVAIVDVNATKTNALNDIETDKTEALAAIAALGNTWDAHYESLIAEMPADLASITQTLAILGRILTGESEQPVTFFMGDYAGGSKTTPTPASTSDVSTNMIIGGAGFKFAFTLDKNEDADTKIYAIRWFEGKDADTGVYTDEHVVSCGNVRTYNWTVPDTCYGFSITLRNSDTLFTEAPASDIVTLRWYTTISDLVSVDGDQDFTDEQKAQGRENIDAASVDDITELESTFDKITSVEEINAVKKIGYYVSDGRYVGADATSCIFVIDLTNIESNSELEIEISGTANRCRFLFSQTLAADVDVSTGGEYVDYGNDIRSVSVPYATWSQYNTIVVCTNYRTGEPYASVIVTGGNVTIKTDAIPNDSITANKCSFFKKCEQLLKSEASSVGFFWNINASGNATKSSSADTHAYEPVKLFAGVKYRLINVFGYFTLVANLDGSNASRVTDSQSNSWSGYYTPENDCYLFATVQNNYYGTTGMVLNDAQYVPSEYVEGIYYTYFIGNTENKVVDLHVKADGTGDYTSVVDAVNFANAQKGNFTINIYIHTGDYDILEELGGDTFLASVLDSIDERQGLVLKANNINLIGVGHVVLRYELNDDVDYYQSSRTSCLNLREYSNRVENLTLIAKNCRYTIHDETNGGNPYIHRIMKNLRCIHKGNASGLWAYPTVLGGGAGGGSTYDIINCQFITSTFFRAFSYHSGTNEEASMFNIDGCVGSVKDDAPTKTSFRLSYHGTGRTGISVGNIKNCSGNGQAVVEPESAGDTGNNIEMYVNGWETIEPIPVTGNE